MRPGTRLVVASAIVVSLLGAACGGSSDSSKPSTSTSTSALEGATLTDAQALQMSRILVKDREAGGASFVIDLPSRGQVVAQLRGDVDWAHDLARASYVATTGPVDTTDYEWNRSIVLVGGLAGLEDAMAAQGRPGVTWISRPLDPTTTPLDGVLALVFTLAADQPDNPQLFTQNGARYLGRRSFDDLSLVGYRYSANVTYWVGPTDGLVHRVEAHFRSFSDPIVVTLTDHGPRDPDQPQKSEVVDASSIPELYEQLTGDDAPTLATPPPGASTTTAP